jgi:NAD-dependent SIR2 family protein deacetylase
MEVLTEMEMSYVWTGGLTLFTGLFAYIAHEKFSELARITILLNKTHEEIARDNVTKAEVERITDHIDQRFNRLEAKIDQLIQAKG